MAKFKGIVFPSWKRNDTDAITAARERRALAAKAAKAGRVERVPGRSLPYGHKWAPHDKATGKAAERRRRQMARASQAKMHRIAPEKAITEETPE